MRKHLRIYQFNYKMDTEQNDITPEMKVLKEVIGEYEEHIRYFEMLINEYKLNIKEKEKRFFSLCEHVFVKERENIPYGELFHVCKKCGFYK